jgi:hypothetical protein
MSTLFRISTILSVFILLASCGTPGPTATSAPPDSATPLVHPSMTVTPSLTATVTVTVSPASTATPHATPTITMTPRPIIRQQTLTIENGLPSGSDIKGVLVMQGQDENYLLDIQSMGEYHLSTVMNSRTKLSDSLATSPEIVSPDRKWLAYIELLSEPATEQLRVVTAYAQQQPIQICQDDLQDVIGWVDNERLAFTKRDHPDGTVIIYNPFTGECNELTSSFPPIFQEHPEGLGAGLAFWHASTSPFVIYDPFLTKVAYMQLKDVNNQHYILWDTQSANILWEKSTKFFDSRPVWSPDGEYFAVAINPGPTPANSDVFADLFMVSRDGQETLLTDRVAGSLAWSPDGSSIATWWGGHLDCSDSLTAGLAIVGVKTKNIMVYCIQPARLDQYPIWSPDGRYIALDSPSGDIDPELRVDISRVIIVDLAQNKAYEVARVAKVRGWMINFPQVTVTSAP